MTSTISDTDLQVFANLVNPSKANINQLKEDDRNSIIEKDDNSDSDERASEKSDERSEKLSEKSDASRQASRQPSPKSEVSQTQQSVFSRFSQRSVARPVEDDQQSTKSDDEISNTSDRSFKSEHGAASHVSKKSVASMRSTHSRYSHHSQNYQNDNHNRVGQPNLPYLNTDINSENGDQILEKQQVLMDMERLKLQGIKLTKEWTLNDRLDDMQFEVRRHMLHLDEMNNINMMRDGMRLMCSGFEMINGKLRFLELDGWASEVCSDMNKYDNALGRIYRKYWRRGTQNSPEMEIAMGLIGSMGMYHFKKKMQTNMFGGAQGFAPNMPSMPGNMANMAASMAGMNNSFPPFQNRKSPSQARVSEETAPRAVSDSDSDDESVPP